MLMFILPILFSLNLISVNTAFAAVVVGDSGSGAGSPCFVINSWTPTTTSSCILPHINCQAPNNKLAVEINGERLSQVVKENSIKDRF